MRNRNGLAWVVLLTSAMSMLIVYFGSRSDLRSEVSFVRREWANESVDLQFMFFAGRSFVGFRMWHLVDETMESKRKLFEWSSLFAEYHQTTSKDPTTERSLHYRSLYLHASVVLAFFLIPMGVSVFILIRRRQRRLRRQVMGHCLHCDYDLQGITSHKCPECGYDTVTSFTRTDPNALKN